MEAVVQRKGGSFAGAGGGLDSERGVEARRTCSGKPNLAARAVAQRAGRQRRDQQATGNSASMPANAQASWWLELSIMWAILCWQG